MKGPTAKIMGELGVALTQASVAAHYRGLLDGLMLDTVDASEAGTLGMSEIAIAELEIILEDVMAQSMAATFAIG